MEIEVRYSSRTGCEERDVTKRAVVRHSAPFTFLVGEGVSTIIRFHTAPTNHRLRVAIAGIASLSAAKEMGYQDGRHL